MASKKTKSLINSPKDKGFTEARFKEVYNTYFDRLYAYVKVICNSDELTEDIIADLFHRLWENKPDFGNIKDLEAYLFVSAKNQAFRALVKELKLTNTDFIEIREKSIEYINPEHLLLEKELKATLDKAVGKLPDKCQLVYRMAREQGLKYREISHELGISVETVKSHLSKAQLLLKEEVAKFYELKGDNNIPDIRMIGVWLVALGFCCYDI